MGKKYRNHTPDFKLKVALEAARNDKTINQIASEYSISGVQVIKWKKRLLAEGASLFKNKRTMKHVEAHEDVELLQKQIGKQSIQIEWLKKKLGIAS